MKTKSFLIALSLLLALYAISYSQNNLLQKAKNSALKSLTEDASESESTKAASKSSDVESKPATKSTTTTSSASKTTASASVPTGTATLYVSEANGSNRNDGSKEKPIKDLQKAVDVAPEGAVILVSEGNYQGRLDAGYVEIKKYLSIIGGYNQDFSKCNPKEYLTTIRPGPAASGTNANHGLLDIYVRGKKDGVILIDGLILDKGDVNCYFIANPDIPKSGTPEGCITGRLDPPGFGSSGAPKMEDRRTVSNQLIHGDVEGNVTIRNCVLMNGSHFGIQMGNAGGKWKICNNIFLANRMAACEIRGMTANPGEAIVDFHHNTVLFVWRRDPNPASKDMGYGFRYMTRVDANVHHNIFGAIDFAALDRTYIDSDRNKEAQRKTSAWNNLFFSNIEADLTLPSGGGKFMRIFSRQFEDVEQLIEYEGNHEMTQEEAAQLAKAVDTPYLKGFLSMDGTSSMTHNPNSSENILRSALGMNQRGTSSYSVSMYMNQYPLEKAPALFGAIKGFGAQDIK